MTALRQQMIDAMLMRGFSPEKPGQRAIVANIDRCYNNNRGQTTIFRRIWSKNTVKPWSVPKLFFAEQKYVPHLPNGEGSR